MKFKTAIKQQPDTIKFLPLSALIYSFLIVKLKVLQYADYFYTSDLIKLTDDEHTCIVSHFKSLWIVSDTCFGNDKKCLLFFKGIKAHKQRSQIDRSTI